MDQSRRTSLINLNISNTLEFSVGHLNLVQFSNSVELSWIQINLKNYLKWKKFSVILKY